MDLNLPPADPTAPPTPSKEASFSSLMSEAQPSQRLRGEIRRAGDFIHRHEFTLWWLHSTYALLLGIGAMWLVTRNYGFLRLVLLYIGFIWITSLFLPVIVNRPWLTPKWRERLRLVINYFNKNFYQQLLFFLLPIYYASTTFGSRNMIFFLLLTASAVLSTMDIVYDRYVSVQWQLTALFFMFNLFASINVMLPLLWAISNHWALWISAILAFGGFASMVHRLAGLRGPDAKILLGVAGVALFIIIWFFAPYIPPAPLTLGSTEFGRAVDKSLNVVSPLDSLPSQPGKIVAVTSIKAPLGLKEQVRHRWLLDGKVIFVSKLYSVTGGRKEGYRLWTQITLNEKMTGRVLAVEVETHSGQLIGRAKLRS